MRPLLGFVREDARGRVVCVFNFSAETVSLGRLAYLNAVLPEVLEPYGCALVEAEMQCLAEAAD